MLNLVENDQVNTSFPRRRNVILIFVAGTIFGLFVNWMSRVRISYEDYASPDTVIVGLSPENADRTSSSLRVEPEQPANSKDNNNVIENDNERNTTTRKRLGDGCRYVYLDVGSNVGVQVRKLFEGEKYPGAPLVRKFEKRFGAQDERRELACAFGIEANPRHEARLKEIETCYHDRMGWRTKFFVPNLADNVDGKQVKFYLDSLDRAKNVASTAFVNKVFRYQESRAVNVTSIDVASFIMKEIVGREIPPGTETPFIYMKLDIEGSEFVVIPDMLAKGVLCHVDEIIIEYHHRFMETAENKELANLVDGLMNSFTKLSDKAIACKRTKFSTQDEETYLRDGKPVPDECSTT